MAKPHKIEAAEMIPYLEEHYVEFASASTADGTQRKHIGRRGADKYIVARRYCAEPGATRQTIYEGTDPHEAVRLYNGLG